MDGHALKGKTLNTNSFLLPHIEIECEFKM